MSSVEIIESIFSKEPDVRYVAIMKDGELSLKERTGLVAASSSDTDKYEEILVNPALLTLTRQRGNIDCGGLKYVVIRYGNFFQWVYPISSGHISVSIDQKADVIQIIDRLEPLLKKFEFSVISNKA